MPFAVASAQSLPPRDNLAAPVGTASIAGRIVADDAAGRPLRHVTVTLASGGLTLPQTTVTDDNGRFGFDKLPAGNYTLVASRLGYVTTFYGAKKPGRGPGVPIAVNEGQRLADISMKVLHGSAITGFVRRQNGQPAVAVEIQALQVQTVNGQRRAVPAAALGAMSRTDDRGVYRIYGLAPGEYVIQARSVFGPGEARQITAAEIQWAQQAVAQDRSAASSGAKPLPPTPQPGQTVSYATVYYPGTADAAAAVSVSLGPNEEKSGVDFSTELVPTARITGTILDPEGRPAQATQVSLLPAQSSLPDLVGMLVGRSLSRTGTDGQFSLNGVTPGRYTLMVRGAPRVEGAGAGPTSDVLQTRMMAVAAAGAMFGGMSSSNSMTLWAMEELTVDGRDITDLTLRLQPGMTIAGKVVYDSTTQQPPTDSTRGRVMLTTMPTGTSPTDMVATMLTGSVGAAVNADGTFSVKGVTPNKYRLNTLAPGMMFGGDRTSGTWVLKSAMLNGTDVADIPFEVRPSEDVSGLVVTLTDRPTELSGTVLDQAGRATPNFPIVVFSTDRAYWTIGSRRVQQSRPSSDGKFRIVGLPAGEYFVCAVTDIEASDLADPAFLEQLAVGSFKITLADGEKKTQDLKLQGGRP